MRRDGIPRRGPKVFTPAPDDKRRVLLVPTRRGYALHVRFPAFVAFLPARPVRESVIYMANRPRPQAALPPDPYHTLPLETP